MILLTSTFVSVTSTGMVSTSFLLFTLLSMATATSAVEFQTMTSSSVYKFMSTNFSLPSAFPLLSLSIFSLL